MRRRKKLKSIRFLGEAFKEETGIEVKIGSIRRGGKKGQRICQGNRRA